MKKMILLVLLFAVQAVATVSDGESIRQYFVCNGSTTTFTFTQPVNSADDILVYDHIIATGDEGDPLTEDTDYTIAATGTSYLNGGVVTISPALESTSRVVIVRNIKKSQETSPGAMSARAAVLALDKLTRVVQDLEDRNDRSWHLQESDGTSFDMEIPGLDERAESYPYFGDDGSLTYVVGVTPDDVPVSSFMETVLDDATAPLAMATLNGWPVINAANSAYGATPEAGNDDTAAIEAAIAALSGSSGVVYLPEGVYETSSTIAVPTGVYIMGAAAHWSTDAIGTRIVSTVDGAACFKFGDGSTLVHSGGIRNIRITASGTGIDGIGIHLSYAKWIVIDSVSIFDFSTGTGIKIEGQTAGILPAQQNTVSNIYLANNLVNLFLTGQNANNSSACDESIFTNIRIQPSTLTNSIGIRMRKGQNNTFRNVVISDTATTSGTIGIDLVNGGSTDLFFTTRGNTFTNTALEFLTTAIQIGTFPHGNTFYDTRFHIETAKTMVSDSSGGANRFIGVTGGENLPSVMVLTKAANQTNLLINGEFERWEAGTSVAPTGWSLVGFVNESIIRSIDRHKGSFSAGLVSATANARVLQTLTDIDYLKGRWVTAACWVKASYTPSGSSLIHIRISDGVANVNPADNTKSFEHSGNDTWELLTVKRFIEATATKIQFDITITGATDTIEIDQAMLVEGIEVSLPSSTPVGYVNYDAIIPPQIMSYENTAVFYENEQVTFKE